MMCVCIVVVLSWLSRAMTNSSSTEQVDEAHVCLNVWLHQCCCRFFFLLNFLVHIFVGPRNHKFSLVVYIPSSSSPNQNLLLLDLTWYSWCSIRSTFTSFKRIYPLLVGWKKYRTRTKEAESESGNFPLTSKSLNYDEWLLTFQEK